MARDRYLQAIRGLAIACVVCIHCLPRCAASVVLRPFLNWAVAGFLFLSGLLTSESKILRGGARQTSAQGADTLSGMVRHLSGGDAAADCGWNRQGHSVRGVICADVLPARVCAARGAHTAAIPSSSVAPYFCLLRHSGLFIGALGRGNRWVCPSAGPSSLSGLAVVLLAGA